MMTDSLKTLTNKQMSRKEFLLYIGAVLIALTGIQSVMKTVIGPEAGKKPVVKGFGYGPYGGKG